MAFNFKRLKYTLVLILPSVNYILYFRGELAHNCQKWNGSPSQMCTLSSTCKIEITNTLKEDRPLTRNLYEIIRIKLKW